MTDKATASPGERPALRLDTTMASAPAEENLPERLVTAIAGVLAVPRGDILLHDSFRELGGDHKTAGKLVSACSAVGMMLREEDVLRCRTISELQTCLRPAGSPAQNQPWSPCRESDASSHLSETFSIEARSSNVSDLSNSPTRISGELKRSTVDEGMLLTEDLLTTTSQVPYAALIRPAAGYFEGKLVAFLTLLDISAPEPETPRSSETSEDDIALIPPSHHHHAASQIAALRHLLENSTTITALPITWIVLSSMPLLSGAPDRRRLRTWIQNMSEELYRQVMSVDSPEPLQEPTTEMEREVQRVVAGVLRSPSDGVGMNFSFRQLGGDEFSALQLVAACRARGIRVSTGDIAQSDSLAHLAFLASYKGGVTPRWEGQDGQGRFPLSPMQQLYFRTGIGGDYAARSTAPWEYRFNQSLLLKINAPVSSEDVHAAVEAVAGHHPMLRARFAASQGCWVQSVAPEITASYRFGQHVVGANDEVLSIIRASQARIDVETGPVFCAEMIRTTDGETMLFVVAHHLVVDLISWRVVVHDLDELLRTGSLYSSRAMPFQRWTELQSEQLADLKHPLLLPFNTSPADFSFWGLDPSQNTYGDAKEVSFALASDLTSLLQTTCNDAFRTDSTDIYLAALLLSFSQAFPERGGPVVWSQEHGREGWGAEVDIAETVGWFTTLCAVGAETGEDFVGVLKGVKDARRRAPRKGWAHFASKFLGEEGNVRTEKDWPAEIMFTYAGSMEQLDPEGGILSQLPIPGPTLGSSTSDIGPRVGRVALFEVSTMVDHGVAKVKVLYNKGSKHQERIEAWVSTFEHMLLDGVGRLRHRAQELTLSDVPLLDVTYEGLAKLNGDRLLALNIPSAREIESVYPVTPLQQDALLSQSKEIESCHLHATFEFSPAPGAQVDSGRLCTAWQQTVAKYAALRTVFIESVEEGGLFDQVVLRKCSPAMLFIDAGEDEDAVAALERLPPLKCTASDPRHRLSLCTARESTFLKLEVSQAVCDAASLERIASDLRRAYASGHVASGSLELSYPEYIRALREARVDSKPDFWRAQLRGCRPCLFPALGTPPEGNTLVTNYKTAVSAADLDAYCRRVNVKRAAVLRVAWALVLGTYTGSKGVCFGYRHSGHDAPKPPAGIDSAVGAFENTLVCTLDLAPGESLSSAVQAAEDQLSLYLPHQFTPLSEIEHAVILSGSPLFNTCLSFHDEARGLKSRFNSDKSSSRLECVRYYNTLDHDLSVSVMFNDGVLDVTIAHRILTSAQAENVAHALGTAVKAILDSQEGTVGGVDLFSDRDYAQLPPAVPQGKERGDLPVHTLVESVSKDDPDAPAVAGWDGRLSYAQLWRLASRLAAHLVELGVRKGTPVPLLLGKSKWAAVAILAVLASGGSFVPLDEEDTAFSQKIIQRLGSTVVLATDVSARRLNSVVEHAIIIDDVLFSQALGNGEVPEVSMTDPACLVFHTPSGRSKEAKGVFFTHSALSAAFVAQGSALGIDVSSRVMQLSSFSSDTALSEVLTTLVHGGCVCVPRAHERTGDLSGAIQRLDANWTYFTPVLARRLVPSMIPTVKTICFRTRRLDADTFSRWSAKTRVLLSYGTSDICPLGISVSEVTSPTQLSRIAQPFIGRFWIVNPEDHRRLMPIGAIGELAIESPTLAHKLPKNYSPRETPLPQRRRSGSGTGTRLFRTGHRVRYMSDSTLEFITSCRDEVSVNGNVIPVPIVEGHIRRCMGSRSEVVVDKVITEDGATVLTAFVELGTRFEGEEDLALLSPATRERAFVVKKLAESYLQTVLPSYMLPAAFVPLKLFPVTSSLKVHRRKLQKMASSLTESELLAIATVPHPDAVTTPHIKPLPLTQVEKRMRALWAPLLNLDAPSIAGTQSFLRLGGNTHLAAKLIVACRREGLPIPIGAVLQGASLTELCQSITLSEEPMQAPAETVPVEVSPSVRHVMSSVAPAVGIETGSIVEVAPATDPQIRALEAALRVPGAGVNHLVLHFSGLVDAKRMETACRDLVRVHGILSTSFVTHNRKVYQVVTSSTPDYSRVQSPSWRVAAAVEKHLRKDQDSQMSRPATKFTFIDGGKHSALIIRLLAFQHDDGSLPLLLQDLRRLYTNDSTLHRPSFTDFSRSAAGDVASFRHWSNLLHGASITPILPHQRPPKPTTTPKTISATVPVSGATTSQLSLTFDTVLKAAWSVVLATLSCTPDVTFGEKVDGRHVRVPSQGLSGVLGPLHNTIPVRVNFEGSGTPLELLLCVHEQRLASLPHENVGLYELVERCTPWPYWSRFSSVVQHRYREGLGDAARFSMGGADCEVIVEEAPARDLPDLFVSSVQACPERSDISITFCEGRIPRTFVETVLGMLVSAIDSLSALHDAIIPSSKEIMSGVRQLPLPHVDFQPPAHPQAPNFEIKETVAKAWADLLDPRAHGVPEEHVATASFYDLWGCLIPGNDLAARLTRDLEKYEVSVSMEEVIENPTQQKQLALIAKKMASREREKETEKDRAHAWKGRLLSMREKRLERKASRDSFSGGPAGTGSTGSPGASVGMGGVSPIAEDEDYVLTAQDTNSPVNSAEYVASGAVSEESAERKLKRQASKVFGRMSRLSFTQPRTGSPT